MPTSLKSLCRIRILRRLVLVLASGLLACSGLQAATLGIDALPGGKARAGSMQKLGPQLMDLIEAGEARSNTAFTAAVRSRQVRTDGSDRVQVYIHFDPLGDPVEAVLEQMGVEQELVNYNLGIVQGWISIARLPELAELPFVVYMEVPHYARFRTGSETSEAVALLRADDLHALGVTGSGVRVGVLSDGVNNRADAQGTGDLPSDISVFGSCTTPLESPTCNEGTAMLEIIHDIAPDAELGFCALSTNLEFIDCVQRLQSSFGADIFVDDIGFFGEPYFEDGSVAQAVANVASTYVYVSAAGNDARDYYEAEFRSTVPTFSGGKAVHDFGLAEEDNSDIGNTLQLTENQQIEARLQWNDPFNDATADYELWLMNEDFTETLDVSTPVGLNSPQVQLSYSNTEGSSVTVQLVIVKQEGEDRHLKMFVFGPEPEYVTPEGSVFGHPAVSDVVATAAINASDPGLDTIASYSSRGPTFIAFPVAEQRQKPDLTAIDGTSVTGAGGFPTTFFGTSAAAPHVAGVAALLKSLDSQPSRDTVVAAMKVSAIDLGTPGTDNTYGAGRLDAMAAFQAISSGLGSGSNNSDGDDAGDGGGCALRSRPGGLDPLLLVLSLLAAVYLGTTRSPL